jgi:hypothetical protein
MTEQEINDKLEELENLKLLLKFHSENRVINPDRKFMEYVDEILDEINRIEKELKDGEK